MTIQFRRIFKVWSIAILFAPVALSAQEFMDVADFLKVTSRSQNKYEFSILEGRIQGKPDPGMLNFNYYFLADSAGIKIVRPFELDQDSQELQDLAREALMLGEPDTALVLYGEVLSGHGDYSPAMTGKALAYQQLGKHREAIGECLHAIRVNPIDYVAYWNLAVSYNALMKKDSAINAICHAWILNRNSIEIVREVEHIFNTQGEPFNNWQFVPQYRAGEMNGKIVVEYNPAWLGYAVCQAVWEFEPGFDSSRTVKGDQGMFRERECLSCLLTSMESDPDETSRDKALKAFKTALQNKMALEFILFEILLPGKPDMAYLLNDTRVERLIGYLKTTRNIAD